VQVLRSSSITLTAYLEDLNNNPKTSYNANVRFVMREVDGSYSKTAASSRELGNGWYAYDFTASSTDFIFHAYDNLSAVKTFPGGHVEVINILDYNGTATHSSSYTEQIVFCAAATGMHKMHDIRLDLSNLTKRTLVRVHEKIDGANYMVVDSIIWDTNMNDGVAIGSFLFNKNIKVSLTSYILEGAQRSVPYRYKVETF